MTDADREIVERLREEAAELQGLIDHLAPGLQRRRYEVQRDDCQNTADLISRLTQENEGLRTALAIVDTDVRHHLRSDAIATALIRPHAVKAVRDAMAAVSLSEEGMK